MIIAILVVMIIITLLLLIISINNNINNDFISCLKVAKKLLSLTFKFIMILAQYLPLKAVFLSIL